jgi:hypothetical protein
MKSRKQLILSAAIVTFSTQPSLASFCSQDIDRACVQVNAKIQARVAAGRSAPQGTIALLHHQPTPVRSRRARKSLLTSGCRSRRLWRPSLVLVKRMVSMIGSPARELLQTCSA